MDMPAPGTGPVKIDKIGPIRLDMEVPGDQGYPVDCHGGEEQWSGSYRSRWSKENGICPARCAA